MILHFDVDAFFASVEQASDVRLRGMPVAVGGERGVVCSASYEARAYGIHSAMPMRRAVQLCPGLRVMRGRFELYEQFSERIFDACEALSPDIERTSIDEGYVDLAGRREDTAGKIGLVRRWVAEVRGEMRMSLSCGLSAKKRVAQIAGKAHKPNGFTVVPTGGERAFLQGLGVGELPGVGPVAARRLAALGLRTIGDLQAVTVEQLYPVFGRGAAALHALACGEDSQRVEVTPAVRKGYSMQETLVSESSDAEALLRLLKGMLSRLLERLRGDGRSARTLAVGIRYTDYERKLATHSLLEPSNLDPDFMPLVGGLLERAWQRRVRLNQVSVQLQQLYPAWMQGELFSRQSDTLARLYRARDQINLEMGQGTVRSAALLE